MIRADRSSEVAARASCLPLPESPADPRINGTDPIPEGGAGTEHLPDAEDRAGPQGRKNMTIQKLLAGSAAGAIDGDRRRMAEIVIGASLPLTARVLDLGRKHSPGLSKLCVELINERGRHQRRAGSALITSDNRSGPRHTRSNQYERFITWDGCRRRLRDLLVAADLPGANILARNAFVHPAPAGGRAPIYTQGHPNLFIFPAPTRLNTSASFGSRR